MSTFDPTKPAILHSRDDNEIITWTGEYGENFKLNHTLNDDGSVEWDGRVLDGWGQRAGWIEQRANVDP